MQIPLNDLARNYRRHQTVLEQEILAVFRSGRWLNGDRAAGFAAQFSAFVGTVHCIPVGNGSDAIEIVLRALGQLGTPAANEVVTVANAGGYTTTACRRIGLLPVYVDIVPDTLLMDIGEAAGAVNERTVAVVATHLFGKVVDIDGLRAALDTAGHGDVPILEDCAQAHGATLRGRRVGGIGQVSAFSFFPTKNLGAFGDAGAVMTSDPAIAGQVARLHQYGWSTKYRVELPGGQNSRIDEVQAGILATLLPGLDDANAERLAIFDRYNAAAAPEVTLLPRPPGEVVHLAVALCDDRDAFRAHLARRGIATDIHYPILDSEQPAWRDLPQRGSEPGRLANSKAALARLVTLPCFVGMTEDEIDRVADALSGWGTT